MDADARLAYLAHRLKAGSRLPWQQAIAEHRAIRSRPRGRLTLAEHSWLGEELGITRDDLKLTKTGLAAAERILKDQQPQKNPAKLV